MIALSMERGFISMLNNDYYHYYNTRSSFASPHTRHDQQEQRTHQPAPGTKSFLTFRNFTRFHTQLVLLSKSDYCTIDSSHIIRNDKISYISGDCSMSRDGLPDPLLGFDGCIPALLNERIPIVLFQTQPRPW